MKKEHTWQLQEAKARLSELVRDAQNEGPQKITVHGDPAVVVLSQKDFLRLIRPEQSFLEMARRSPLYGVDLKLKRDRSPTRDVSL